MPNLPPWHVSFAQPGPDPTVLNAHTRMAQAMTQFEKHPRGIAELRDAFQNYTVVVKMAHKKSDSDALTSDEHLREHQPRVLLP